MADLEPELELMRFNLFNFPVDLYMALKMRSVKKRMRLHLVVEEVVRAGLSVLEELEAHERREHQQHEHQHEHQQEIMRPQHVAPSVVSAWDVLDHHVEPKPQLIRPSDDPPVRPSDDLPIPSRKRKTMEELAAEDEAMCSGPIHLTT
jgi:hypothetical protein